MDSLSIQDKINMAIAIGTGIAAFSSMLAAIISSMSSRRALAATAKTSREEKDRWLTGLLFSLANQCNECVSVNGKVMPTEANLSRMITILYNAVDLIKREKNPENRPPMLRNFWIFLHSSIWVEIEKGDVMSSLKEFDPSSMAVISSQYQMVRNELMRKVK